MTRKFDPTLGQYRDSGKFDGNDNQPAAGGMNALDGNKDWGSVALESGDRTPWGPAQEVVEFAPGMVVVATDGHGGFKLSAQRNKEIHPALRRTSGWYEEDCEAHIVKMQFPEDFGSKYYGRSEGFLGADELLEMSRDGVRRHYPDEFEKATGEEVLPGQSPVRDRNLWMQENAENSVVVSASRSDTIHGHYEVSTRVGADTSNPQLVSLVPAEEYKDLSNGAQYGTVIDPTKYPDITPPPPAPEPKFHSAKINVEGTTQGSQALVQKDLNQRWRSDDGTVRTLAQLIETEGVTGKSAEIWDDGEKINYYLHQREPGGSGGAVFKVSRATWAALEDVPDTRTEKDKAQTKYEQLTRKAERAGEQASKARGFAASSELHAESKRLFAKAKEAMAPFRDR